MRQSAPMRRAVVAACFAALLIPTSAFARTSPVELLDVRGNIVAQASAFPFAFPAGGSLISVRSAWADARGVELSGITLLGGRVHADSIFVPARGTAGARVDGLVVDGLAAQASTNTLIPLGGGDYVVTLQTARVGKSLGLVGLRVASAGQEIVLAPAAAAAARTKTGRKAAARWSLLGFAALPTGHGVSVLEPFPTVLQANAYSSRAVGLALQLLGIPYVWGGATPAGFDCSGLVMYVYGHLGIQLTHYSGAQFHEGAEVSPEQLLPGDIVFFHPGPRGPQHEGLYIGNGEFVHAPHTGDVVKISSLADPAYALTYAGAVRPY
jgi:cell wall-associated NlpC family hydrolase